MFFGWFFTLAVISVIPAWIAQTKGRNFWGWWIYALFLWPITLIHSVVISADTKKIEKRQLQSGHKKCPACAEIIKAEAKLCKHCGTEQEEADDSEIAAIGAEGAVDVYKGQAIHEIPNGFTAMGSWFKTLEQAKNYIDKNT